MHREEGRCPEKAVQGPVAQRVASVPPPGNVHLLSLGLCADPGGSPGTETRRARGLPCPEQSGAGTSSRRRESKHCSRLSPAPAHPGPLTRHGRPARKRGSKGAQGFPSGMSGKEPTYQCRRCKRWV